MSEVLESAAEIIDGPISIIDDELQVDNLAGLEEINSSEAGDFDIRDGLESDSGQEKELTQAIGGAACITCVGCPFAAQCLGIESDKISENSSLENEQINLETHSYLDDLLSVKKEMVVAKPVQSTPKPIPRKPTTKIAEKAESPAPVQEEKVTIIAAPIETPIEPPSVDLVQTSENQSPQAEQMPTPTAKVDFTSISEADKPTLDNINDDINVEAQAVDDTLKPNHPEPAITPSENIDHSLELAESPAKALGVDQKLPNLDQDRVENTEVANTKVIIQEVAAPPRQPRTDKTEVIDVVEMIGVVEAVENAKAVEVLEAVEKPAIESYDNSPPPIFSVLSEANPEMAPKTDPEFVPEPQLNSELEPELKLTPEVEYKPEPIFTPELKPMTEFEPALISSSLEHLLEYHPEIIESPTESIAETEVFAPEPSPLERIESDTPPIQLISSEQVSDQRPDGLPVNFEKTMVWSEEIPALQPDQSEIKIDQALDRLSEYPISPADVIITTPNFDRQPLNVDENLLQDTDAIYSVSAPEKHQKTPKNTLDIACSTYSTVFTAEFQQEEIADQPELTPENEGRVSQIPSKISADEILGAVAIWVAGRVQSAFKQLEAA